MRFSDGSALSHSPGPDMFHFGGTAVTGSDVQVAIAILLITAIVGLFCLAMYKRSMSKGRDWS